MRLLKSLDCAGVTVSQGLVHVETPRFPATAIHGMNGAMRALIPAFILTLVACGPSLRTVDDASFAPPDSGDYPEDGGVASDGGHLPDGGFRPDGGVTPDGGLPTDGGADCTETCSGCCTQEGVCVGGTSDNACGRDGQLCAACGDSTCTVGGVCMTGNTVVGDNCTAPRLLVPDSHGNGTVTVDLSTQTALVDDDLLSCGASRRIDVVLAFDVLHDNTYVDFQARAHDGSGTPVVVALRDVCDVREREWTCQEAPVATVGSTLSPGRYFAWVESSSYDHTVVDVTYHLTDPPSVGDTCAIPQVLSFTGDTAQASDDLSRYTPTNLSCAEGRDATYSFTLGSDAFVTITMTPGGDFTPEIDFPACLSQTSCYTGSAPGVARSLTQMMTAGTHSFNVTSADGAGPYVVTVTRQTRPPGDTCETASPVTFTNGVATKSVPLTTLNDDFTSACLSGGTSGKDAIYTFTTTAAGDFTARLSGDFSANYDVLTLRSTCGGPDIVCGNAIAIRDLPAGDYYILVDSFSSTTATVLLTMTSAPAATTGASCLRPDALSLSNGAAGGTAHVTGTLAGATDVFTGSCLNSGHGGVDHIYSFTIDRPLILKATAVVPTRATYALRLGKSASECTRGAATACNELNATTVPLIKRLDPGSYLLAVEGAITTYTLDLSLTDPPAGEYCGNAVDIDFTTGPGTQTDRNTTIGGLEDNGNNACAGYDMPDRVYRITTVDPFTDLSATITARNGTNAPKLLFTRGECNSYDNISCQGTGTAATRSVRGTSLPPGTYTIWAEGPTIAGADYDLTVTAKPTLAGDTCDVALPLAFPDGVAHSTGNTTGFEDDYSSCNQTSPTFADTVYSFTTDQEYDFKATMTPTSPTGRGALSLLGAMCQVDYSHCVTAGTSPVPLLKVGGLGAGPHMLSVDYSSGGPGGYTLDAVLAPHQLGETCSNPMPLAFSNGAAGGTASVNVDLRDYFHDASTVCGYNGSDIFFTFTTDRALDLRLTSAPGTGTGTIKATLVTACGEGSIGCDSLYSNTWSKGSLAPGTYVFAVGLERQNEEGPVGLNFSLTPPAPGDTCANALDLGLPGSGGQVDVSGSTLNLFDERTGSCAYDTYGDIVYTFTTTRTLSFYATLTSPTGSGSHAMYLRRGDCTATTDLSCSAGNADRTSVRAADLAPGTYFLIVDRANYNTPTDFTLHAWTGDRPAGDTCASALPLGLPSSGSGEVTVQGDTSAFFQDVTASCGTTTAAVKPAADVVYTFTTQAVMNLRLYVQATATGFRPTVALRSGCGTSTDNRCAYVPTFANDAWTSYPALPAGTWYVVVDGYDATEFGPYSLTARLSANQIPGESCTNPAPLTFTNGNSGTASASFAFADFFPDHTDCWTSEGADVVYAITTDRARRLHVRAEPSATVVQPDLSIRKAPCASSSSALACNRPEYDGTGRVSADLAAGTSYVLVKSPLTNPSGSVVLDFELDSFAAGDVCSQALPLNFSNGAAGGTASAAGDLFAFGSDDAPSCGRTSSPDLFYSFTTNRMMNLNVSLTREDNSASFAMALEGACATTELVCASSSFSSGPVVLTKNALPAGSYTLIVQGGAEHPSGFTLAATLAP